MNWDFKAYGKVELIQARGGRLCLQAANKDSVEAYTFGEDDLAELFATIKKSGMEAHADNFVIFGDKLNDKGRPISLPASKQKENGYDLAYEAFQFAKLEPVSYRMLVSWKRPKLGIYTTDYKPASNGAKKTREALTIERVTLKTEKPVAPKMRTARD